VNWGDWLGSRKSIYTLILSLSKDKRFAKMIKKLLIYSTFVIPAKAGIQWPAV